MFCSFNHISGPINCKFHFSRKLCSSKLTDTSYGGKNWYSTVRRTVVKSKQPIHGVSDVEVPVQQALRKLYLKVHPDLFVKFPEQQKKNQESFQRLNEFLSYYKENKTKSTRDFPLEFYYSPNLNDPGLFKRVTARLVTPRTDLPILIRDRYVQSSLIDLLKNFGLNYKCLNLSKFSPDSDKDGTSLILFLISAGEFYRRKDSHIHKDFNNKLNELQKQNSELRDELKNIFNCDFEISIPLIYFNGSLDKAAKIKSSLDNIKRYGSKNILNDRTILFSNKAIPWNWNTYTFDMSNPSSWPEHFENLKSNSNYVETIINTQNQLKSLKSQIEELSPGLKVSWDSTVLDKNSEYTIKFLQDWVDSIRRGAWKFSNNKPMSFYLINLPNDESAVISFNVAENAYNIDPKIFSQFYDQINSEFSSLIEHQDQVVKLLDDFINITKIKELYFDPNITPSKFDRFIQNINSKYPQLESYLNGAKIRVGDDYGIYSENNLVSIKYNFEL